MNLYTSENNVITLTQVVGKGGEATVYEVTEYPDLVAKVYHHPTPTHEAKLQAMVANPPEQPATHTAMAWPTQLLYQVSSKQRRFVGFLMPKVNHPQRRPIFDLYNPARRRLHYPQATKRLLYEIALELVNRVEAIHAKGHLIGDVNESNIFVLYTPPPEVGLLGRFWQWFNQPETISPLVTFVDTDSFQIQAAHGTIYRSLVAKPEYTAPELHGLQLRDIDKTPAHDLFGLAVLLFQLLMEGFHPFNSVLTQADSVGRVDLYCIRRGVFPYYPNDEANPPPHAPQFGGLPPDLQVAFVRCFVGGYQDPPLRPTAEEWRGWLQTALTHLKTCSKGHVYSDHLKYCPQCDPKRPIPRHLISHAQIYDPWPVAVIPEPEPPQPLETSNDDPMFEPPQPMYDPNYYQPPEPPQPMYDPNYYQPPEPPQPIYDPNYYQPPEPPQPIYDPNYYQPPEPPQPIYDPNYYQPPEPPQPIYDPNYDQPSEPRQPILAEALVVDPHERGAYRTLAEALDAVADGGTIVLRAGQHELTYPLTIRQNITLRGEGLEVTELQADGVAFMFQVEGARFSLTDLTLRYVGRDWADLVVVLEGDITMQRCRLQQGNMGLSLQGHTRGEVRDCIFEQNKSHGVEVRGQAQVYLAGNICQDNAMSGIDYIQQAGGTASHNQCRRNGLYGIGLSEYATPTLEANYCYDNQESGIVYWDNTAGAARDNQCYQNGRHGLVVQGQAAPTLNRNQCKSNRGYGLVYFDEAAGVAYQNECTANGFADFQIQDQAHPDIQ